MNKLAVVLVVVALLAMAGTEGMAQREQVRIGISLPLTGPASASGKAAEAGYRLALDEINKAGGVLGSRLQIFIEDDGNLPAKGVPIFTKFVTVDRVHAITGIFGSAIGVSIVGPAKLHEPLIAMLGAASPLVERGFEGYKYLFHYHPWAYHNMEAVFNFMDFVRTGTGASTIAILYEDGPFGSAGVGDTRAELIKRGFDVPFMESFKSGSGDFTALLSRAKRHPVDVLFWIGFDADALPIAVQSREVGFKPRLIFGTPASWPIGFEGNPVARDVSGMAGWTSASPLAASKEFVKKYQAKYGSLSEEYMAPMGFVTLTTLAAAMNKAGTTDKDRVAAELAKTDAETPLGKLRFKPSRLTPSVYQGFDSDLWMVFQFRDGRRVPVWPKSMAAGPLAWRWR
ncbi:MAG: ABC transporter substrate-binding protein [bacterium]|nr:ABC transporter substrate-binding protein [bacterium]